MFPNCPNVEKTSFMSLFFLAIVTLLITFSILLNYNSAVILNRLTDPPKLRNLGWTAYFGLLGIVFSLEFYEISDIFIMHEYNARSYLNDTTEDSTFVTPEEEFPILSNQSDNHQEDHQVEIRQDQKDSVNVSQDKSHEIWSIIALVTLILSIFCVFFQKFLLVFYLMQVIPVFGIFSLYVFRSGPSTIAKFLLFLGLIFNFTSWVSTSVQLEIVKYLIQGEDYALKMCIVPPYWWGDPPRG
jgi:uncharacterized membrane protein HdeD (DUF308 family)